jgi:hypothetical protein
VPAPSLLIIASPYEAELISRELADTGLRVLRADGGEGAVALITTELPIAMVVGTSLMSADPAVVVAEARARHESVPLFLLAGDGDPLVAELGPRATRVFRRPGDFHALAHAIEQIAVDAERADLAEVDSLAPVPALIPRVPTLPFGDLLPVPNAAPLVRAQRTEVLSELPSVTLEPQVVHTNGGAAALLRADDAIGELARLDLGDLAAPKPVRAFEDRSTIARELDRELSQAERRLFPDGVSTPILSHGEDYDDPLADIDLDALALDTIPGLARSLGIEDRPRRTTVPITPVAEPLPLLPVQEEGVLAEVDIAELLARLHGNAFSGALKIVLPEGDKILYLDQGEPVGARSTLRHDQLAELLFREGKLTREQLQRARVDGEPGGASRPVALRLVDEGVLKEREIFPAMRRHAEELLYSLFALEAGRYELGPSLPAAEERVRLSAPTWALILEGVRRKYGLERLTALLGGRGLVLRPTTSFERVVEAAALSAEERRVVALLDGGRSLAEVRAALGGRIAESVVFALAWMLRAAGAVDAGEGVGDLRSASTVVTAPPESAERRTQPRADGAQRSVEEQVERERIASKRAQIADANYFAILGVARDASDHELRRAHERLRADFDPAHFSPETATAHREALEEIGEILDEALRVLLVRGIRAHYAEHLPGDELTEIDTLDKREA